MKLQQFFDTQKNITYTDIDKLNLYQSILYKKTKNVGFKRGSFVRAKYFVYSMISVVLIMGVYGVYFMNNGNLQEYNRFAIKQNTTNTAQADYIAQVIEVKGNFFVEHNGVLTTTNNIGNGDTILLKKDTQLVFEINSGTQSKIIGPAKLVIQKTNIDNYKLNLIYGDFIQMEGNQEKKQTIELAINDITVKQQDKTQPLNFKFVKQGKNQVFQNNGANIVVTKTNGEDKTTTISKQQVVAIQNNDIKIFANISKFTKAIEEKNISQTFSLIEEDSNSGTKEKEESILLSLLNTPQIIESKEEITKNISSLLTDEKEILDPIQYEKVSAILYEGAYSTDIKELEKAFIEGDDDTFSTVYNKIERKIETLHQIFDIPYTKQSGTPGEHIEGITIAIKNIQEKITNSYSIPTKYIKNIQLIQKALKNISVQGYGSLPVHNIANSIEENTTQE